MSDLNREVVFYDGECGFCHKWVQFLLSHDRRESPFYFSPRQTAFYRAHVPESLANAETIVVYDSNGNFLGHSTAVAYMLKQLGGRWEILGKTLEMMPRFVRDTGYRFISKIRKRLVSTPSDVCPVVPENLRDRFILEDIENVSKSPGGTINTARKKTAKATSFFREKWF